MKHAGARSRVGLALGWLMAAFALPVAAQYGRYNPPTENTSDTNRYLSPACATLNDAVNTAQRQGNWSTANAARQEFQRKCAQEMQEAMNKRWQQQEGERERFREQKRQAELTREQAAQLEHQCAGMRDVIGLRRKRERENTLNAGEVAQLRQLEGNYNERCLKR